MQLRQEMHLISNALEDLKGIDITQLDVSQLTPFISTMFICTGSSNRHVQALAHNVVDIAKQNDLAILSISGEETADWVLVDLGDIVVHVMQAETRDFYNLESLWSSMEDELVNES